MKWIIYEEITSNNNWSYEKIKTLDATLKTYLGGLKGIERKGPSEGNWCKPQFKK